jgi:hypothetical protein
MTASTKAAHPVDVRSFCLLVAVAAAIFGYNYCHGPIEYPPGILIPPSQIKR